MATAAGPLLLFLLVVAGLRPGSSDTDPQEAAALLALMNQWQNTPPSWGQSNDPCGTPWEGVMCNGSRVTVLSLSTMGLKGTLSGDIGSLTQLQSLTLSFNSNLGGTLPQNIGNLKQLTTLILSGCSFRGNIPDELGSLSQLYFLALNSNQFSGRIPASLGSLSNLYWFDLGDNQLTGPLPISTNNSPGLDLLLNAKHFHFNKNKLSGNISENLFSSAMKLIHVLFDANNFTGEIPTTVGLLQSLEALRLDNNSLSGPVPSSINNLKKVQELNLANNQLTGPMPNLTGMNSLNYVDLSNNTFDSTAIPDWFTTIQSLTVLVIESGRLYGQMQEELFSFPQLEQVILDNNTINGTFGMGSSISPQLQIVNLQNNDISSVTLTIGYNGTLVLAGNPVCNIQLGNSFYCRLQQQPMAPHSTSLASCGSNSCPPDQSLSPQSCKCSYPFEGVLIFRAPYFRDVTNSTIFQQLERSLWTQLSLNPDSVFLTNPFFNIDNYLLLQLKLFPSTGMYFNRSEILRIASDLGNQTFNPPQKFGPCNFIAYPYPFPGGGGGRNSISTGAVAGIASGCIVLVIGLIALGIYAFKQKKRAEKALQLGKPFASWGSDVKDSGDAPQLKGAKWFPFEELKRITDNFSKNNELGSGGYGKVYGGTLSSGQMVAIKRAQQGSMQGAHEFKTEIELLSRVHHKNLVSLVGFCFEQGEQMLVYEFIPNGTLRDSLTGRQLDWKRRLKIALGSARGLAYLHELADPPIIHRDVKTTNILLDENLNAKVADFGLSKLVSDSQKGHVSTQVRGTIGYLDPEYYMTQQLSEKSDVYSFGVVMLELITAKQPIEKGKYIVREVRIAMDRDDEEYCGLREMMDPAIRNAADLTGFRRFVELAIRCVKESAANRPTMNDIVKEIEMMLQDDRLNANSNSASSSTTDFGNTKGAPHHPYDHPVPRKDVSGDAFKYSGGYSFVAKLEPK